MLSEEVVIPTHFSQKKVFPFSLVRNRTKSSQETEKHNLVVKSPPTLFRRKTKKHETSAPTDLSEAGVNKKILRTENHERKQLRKHVAMKNKERDNNQNVFVFVNESGSDNKSLIANTPNTAGAATDENIRNKERSFGSFGRVVDISLSQKAGGPKRESTNSSIIRKNELQTEHKEKSVRGRNAINLPTSILYYANALINAKSNKKEPGLADRSHDLSDKKLDKKRDGSEIENLNEHGDGRPRVITKNRNHLHFAQNVKPSERKSGSSLTLQELVSDKDTNEIHLLHGDEKLLNLSQPEKIYSKHLKKGIAMETRNSYTEQPTNPSASKPETLDDFDKDTAYDSSSTSAVFAGQIKELSSDTKNEVSNCSNKACTNSDPVSERPSKKPKDLYLRKFRECIKLGKKCRWF